MSFSDYANQWPERIAKEPGKGGWTRKPGTVMDRSWVDNYLRERLGDLRVREIDSLVVRSPASDLVVIPSRLRPDATHNGIPANTIDVLKMILYAAVRDGVFAAML